MPKSALEEVSEPVTALPSQPTSGEIGAKARPAPAAHIPEIQLTQNSAFQGYYVGDALPRLPKWTSIQTKSSSSRMRST